MVVAVFPAARPVLVLARKFLPARTENRIRARILEFRLLAFFFRFLFIGDFLHVPLLCRNLPSVSGGCPPIARIRFSCIEYGRLWRGIGRQRLGRDIRIGNAAVGEPLYSARSRLAGHSGSPRRRRHESRFGFGELIVGDLEPRVRRVVKLESRKLAILFDENAKVCIGRNDDNRCNSVFDRCARRNFQRFRV